jgi:hypothetical protein
MANKSRDNVRRELEIIRKLMDEDNLTDRQIIDQLQINERTFFRYKKKLRTIYEKEWSKSDTKNTLYSYYRFKDSLEYAYREAKKIVDSGNSRPMEKLSALETMCSAREQLAELDKDGPSSKIQIPNKVLIVNDPKEIRVQESSQ